MKFLLAVTAALLIHISAFAQASDYDVSKDKETGSVVFKGSITFADLLKEPSFGWLQKGVDAYAPDSAAVKFLRKNLPHYNIVVLMGTWCDDSQNLVPKLYKVLQTANYPMAQYTMYGVDHEKKAKYMEQKIYNVAHVPTIIIVKDHTEIGRIVESIKKNMEIDLQNIIQADMSNKD